MLTLKLLQRLCFEDTCISFLYKLNILRTLSHFSLEGPPYHIYDTGKSVSEALINENS